MTLCRRGRSVFRRPLVRGLGVMSVIGGADLPDVGAGLYLHPPFSHARNAARNWRRSAAHDLARCADERLNDDDANATPDRAGPSPRRIYPNSPTRNAKFG